jgi:hypothetical protein
MRDYLVVVRAGEKSLHPKWLGVERNWDLVVSYYGDNEDAYVSSEYLRVDCKGSKWSGLAGFFTSAVFRWQNYRYIWCPDDDLDATWLSINHFFEICDSIKAELAQPALDWSSYWSHRITLRNTSFSYRATTFVELMAPCFSSQFLTRVLPTFTENNSGWGLDSIWQRYLNKDKLFSSYIVDATPITHTRPVGSANHGVGNGISPHGELELLRTKYKLPRAEISIVGGRLPSGRWIDLQSNRYEFIYRLKKGQFRNATGPGSTLKSFPWLFALLSVTRALLFRRLPADLPATVEK